MLPYITAWQNADTKQINLLAQYKMLCRGEDGLRRTLVLLIMAGFSVVLQKSILFARERQLD
jgi:hypothetical protein